MRGLDFRPDGRRIESFCLHQKLAGIKPTQRGVLVFLAKRSPPTSCGNIYCCDCCGYNVSLNVSLFTRTQTEQLSRKHFCFRESARQINGCGFFKKHFFRHKCFPVCVPRKYFGKNVSATMFLGLRGP